MTPAAGDRYQARPWGERLREWREEVQHWSRSEFREQIEAASYKIKEPRGHKIDTRLIGRWETGEVRRPQAVYRRLLAHIGAPLPASVTGKSAAVMKSEHVSGLDLIPRTAAPLGIGNGSGSSGAGPEPVSIEPNDETATLELSRRAAASNVGHETLLQLEAAVDDLAGRYPVTSPAHLLEGLRQYLSYVTLLMDKRKNLSEHRRLLVVGGWFSLLAATVHIDLKQERAASARLHTASSLAQHAEHDEIRAWCYETEAWRVLTDGHYLRALDLSRVAQSLAPAGSSVEIQSISQEGRALARLDRTVEMRDAIKRVHSLVSPMTRPDRPEHHYKYDPDKSVAYTATTLAWAGDSAAEGYAREVIARLEPAEDVEKWPRRVASANLDLSLALVASARFDEASHAAQKAILSGRVVPSNRWRALEVVRSIENRKIGEAKELRKVYDDTFREGRIP